MGCAESSLANAPLKENDSISLNREEDGGHEGVGGSNPIITQNSLNLLKNDKNYKIKRENVFTEGLDFNNVNNKDNNNNNNEIKIYYKTEQQKLFLCKLILFLSFFLKLIS